MISPRVLRFLLVGAVMTVCNIVLLWLLIDLLGMPLLAACTLSFFVLNLLGYLVNKGFTFRLPVHPEWRELLRYYSVMAVSLAINLALMALLVTRWNWHYLIASVVVTILLAAFNYLGHAGFTFPDADGRFASSAIATPRILQVSAFFASHGGGIEVVADQLAHRLPATGVNVHWMAGKTPGAMQASVTRGLTIDAVSAWDPLEGSFGLPMPLWLPAGLLRLWRAVGASDLVHVHDYLYQPSLAAILFAQLRGKPWVITQHIGEIPFRSARLRTLLEFLNRQIGARVLAAASHAIFVGTPVMQYYQQRARLRSPGRLIPNGVDLQRFTPAPATLPRERDVQVLFVGRFVEKKGLLLLRGCLDLPGLHWTFVGWGPEPPVPYSTQQVTLAGRLPQESIVPYYQRADLLILPSTGEGFPLVVQEALACGTPVLVSREVALAFPARDDTCVFAVDLDVPDGTAALRRALMDLASDPRLLRAGRETARTLARQWSWDGCVQAYRSVYRDLCGR